LINIAKIRQTVLALHDLPTPGLSPGARRALLAALRERRVA
jgi:hypothetical protein